MIDARKYVVLDVETNGLSAIRDDLLSISIYKPDTKENYNRFLPLELNECVITTDINGIKTEDLKDLEPLSQSEVDDLIEKFELKNRIILTYGGIDEKFISKYFSRHKLEGINYFAFYNFKHEIISSRFSEGNITKDNLCRLYKIENVQDVHSGNSDCILEWKLFEKMDGKRLLVTNNKVFEFNDEYLVPASYISTYPNMKYYIKEPLKISCISHTVYSLPITIENLIKFPTNFNGMIFEHLMNSALNVQKVDSREFELENKKKLKFLGKLPSEVNTIPMIFNSDGTLTATRNEDISLEKLINRNVKNLKKLTGPLVKFIGLNIFEGKTIKSQELVVHPEKRVMAVCDLSTENAILEIKSVTGQPIENFAEQLYYESNGRKCYILQMNWEEAIESGAIEINEVTFKVEKIQDVKLSRLKMAQEKIETETVKIVSFIDQKSPVRLKCENCGEEWNTSYYIATKHKGCPKCDKKKKQVVKRKIKLSDDEKQKEKIIKYQKQLDVYSKNKLRIIELVDSTKPVKVKCLVCGYEWSMSRIDRLLGRPYCIRCKKNKNQHKMN